MSARAAMPPHAVRPILITTAALACRWGLLATPCRAQLPGTVLVVAPRVHPAVAAQLQRIASAFAARRPTTLGYL